MESALNVALAILALVSLGCLSALGYMLHIWPKDTSHLGSWVGAFNDGYAKGFAHGENMGKANERYEISQWNTRIPVQQQALDSIGDPADKVRDDHVTVGKWARGPGMMMPSE